MWTIKLKNGTEIKGSQLKYDGNYLDYKYRFSFGSIRKDLIESVTNNIDEELINKPQKHMGKPTLEKVKATYKHAKIVKCASEIYNDSNGIFDISTFTEFRDEENEFHLGKKDFDNSENDEFVTLWNIDNGYAEIIEYKYNSKQMKKVIRLDEPKEESKKPIELTHYHNDLGFSNAGDLDPKQVESIIYLGKCKQDGDVFCVKDDEGFIHFAKGHLNDGVY